MPITVTHSFVSAIPDGADTTLVRPSSWNAAHVISGTTSSTTYYVDGSAGNDSNNGMSTGAAWKTVAKVNASSFSPGDTILFAAGQTFSGAIVCPSAGTSGAPITFGSFGGGQATISSGTSNGFTSTSQAGIVVRDLTFTGSASTNSGVNFNNSSAGNIHFQNIQVINCNVSGYGQFGINVFSSNGYSGYDDILIDGCVVSSCCSVASGIGTSGINIESTATLGSNPPSFNNAIIRNCVSHDHAGTSDTLYTGSGVVVSEINECLIDNCVAYNCGASASRGTVGIWCNDCTYVTISRCIAYHIHTSGTVDGDGFGIDLGSKNCTIRDCYSHDNDGAGFYVFSGSTAGFTNNDQCAIINCTSENDCNNASVVNVGSFVIFANNAITTNIKFAGNRAYQSNASTHVFLIAGTQANAATGLVSDNNFTITGTQDLIFTTANPTSILFEGNRYYIAGSFSIKWNGVTYTDVDSWSLATGQETQGKANSRLANNQTISATLPTFYFNDTETHGHKYGLQAEVNGTTPCFYLFDLTGLVSHWCASFDGAGSFQIRSGSVFGWTASATAADASAADTGISRIAPVSAVPTIAIGNGTPADASGTIQAKTKAGAPTAADVPAGTWTLIRDTTNSTTKLYYNNAGTLQVIALV